MIISGILPDRAHSATISIAGGKVTQIESFPVTAGTSPLPIVAPGFIDAQVNGLGGIAFNDPKITTPQIETVTQRLWETGVAGYLPTLVTDSLSNMGRSVSAIARASRESRAGLSILGIHLEGPFLSPEDGPRGAHPLEHIRPPNWDEFRRLQDAADNKIRLLTVAPETPGAIEFIARVAGSGVRVALGHTAADTDCIRRAIEAGACMSTHLGNAAHDQLQRHRNYVYDQLAADELWASLIVDGHHLPPGLVKVFVRAKTPRRVILVSDAALWAGLPAGVYSWGHCDVEVREDGWIGVVGQPRLAGSGLLLCRGIENVVRFAGVTLAEAVLMASAHPAEMLGVAPRLGTIEVGSDATLTVVDWDDVAGAMHIRQTVIGGETVYAA
jgi:N-acetylglucosamine-6-phosphate deacetylase